MLLVDVVLILQKNNPYGRASTFFATLTAIFEAEKQSMNVASLVLHDSYLFKATRLFNIFASFVVLLKYLCLRWASFVGHMRWY